MVKTEVVINNFNRCDPLKRLLDWLLFEAQGVDCIHIVDNKSDYQPTLDLYDKYKEKVTVHYLNKNMGHNALRYFCSNCFSGREPFIISDPDLYPTCDCPNDLIPYLFSILNDYPKVEKVGVGLNLDLPDCYPLKKRVLLWEKHLIRGETSCGRGLYYPIDTTFCLVRHRNVWNADGNHIRTKEPYLFIHADWMIDPDNLDKEYEHYYQTANNSASYLRELKKYNKFLKEKCVKDPKCDERFFVEKVLNKKYTVRNENHNSTTELFFIDQKKCSQWHIVNEYNILSNHSCIIYNSEGSYAYDYLEFSSDWKSVSGVTSEGHLLKGEIEEPCEESKEIIEIIGQTYEMENLQHNSGTEITFLENGICSAWNLSNNHYEFIGNNSVKIKYSAGNKAIDIVRFNEDHTLFKGESNFGWPIEGRIIQKTPKGNIFSLHHKFAVESFIDTSIDLTLSSNIICARSVLKNYDFGPKHDYKSLLRISLQKTYGKTTNCEINLGDLCIISAPLQISFRDEEAINRWNKWKKERFKDYSALVNDGVVFPPIILTHPSVYIENGAEIDADNLLFLDGSNRTMSYLEAGKTAIDCYVLIHRDSLNNFISKEDTQILTDLNSKASWFPKYHEIREVGLKGQRKQRERFREVYNFDELADSTVVDFGCNIGQSCFEAAFRGAKYIYGFEYQIEALNVAQKINQILGFDIQFRQFDFNRESYKNNIIEVVNEWDYAMYLAIYRTKELSDPENNFKFIIEHTKKAIFFEGHANPKIDTIEFYSNIFSKFGIKHFDYLGHSDNRPAFRLEI